MEQREQPKGTQVIAEALRHLRVKGKKTVTFPELEARIQALPVDKKLKAASLERMFKGDAPISAEDFTSIVLALDDDPARVLREILPKIVGE